LQLRVRLQLRLAQQMIQCAAVGTQVVPGTQRFTSDSLNASHYASTRAAESHKPVYDSTELTRRAQVLIEGVISQLTQREVRGGRTISLMVDAWEALSEMYVRLNDTARAAVTFGRALNAARQLFAPDHERCALLQHKLAEVYMSLGRTDDAAQLLHELRDWCKLCPGDRVPPVPLAVLNHSLGNAMRLAERFAEAEQCYIEVLHDAQCDDDSKSRVLGNLAACCFTQGDLVRAVSFNKQALTLRIHLHGEGHLDVAASYGNLAQLLERRGCWKDALAHAERAIHIIQALFPHSFATHNFYVDCSGIKARATRALKSKAVTHLRK